MVVSPHPLPSLYFLPHALEMHAWYCDYMVGGWMDADGEGWYGVMHAAENILVILLQEEEPLLLPSRLLHYTVHLPVTLRVA